MNGSAEDQEYLDLTSFNKEKVLAALVFTEEKGLCIVSSMKDSDEVVPSGVIVLVALAMILDQHPDYGDELCDWFDKADDDFVRKYVNLPHLPAQDGDADDDEP